MKIQIRPSALEDLAKGRWFYDSQELGIGAYFFDSVFSDIDSLTLYGGIHPKIIGYHRMLTKRFPYAIYYELSSNEIVIVWRVLDLRQDPESIRRKLNK
jgi:plasmid stabilization system protein ParE